MIEIPGGLYDSTRRPKRLRVVSNGDWFLAAKGLFARVGFGELALADLEAVRSDLGNRVFVAHPEVRALEKYMKGGSGRLYKRIRWYESLSAPPMPSVAAVARGAQVAVLPNEGIVWVDGERLFEVGSKVPLPWTDPPVSLQVVRPKQVTAALRNVIGPSGPRHVEAPEQD